jgi:hypothetical protein
MKKDHLSADQVTRIRLLLEQTDLTFSDIAVRMRCSKSTIGNINRRFSVRGYQGRRSRWLLNGGVST